MDRGPLKLFIAVGEPSGDVMAAELVAALKTATDRPIQLMGVGGPNLIAQGLESLFPMQEMTVMGIAEVAPKIPKLLARIRETADAAIAFDPDIVLTVDAPDFSFRVQKKLQKAGSRAKRVHMVAPTVWAWRPGRARKIARFLDHLLVILPFEPPYFEAEGLATSFVGHPIADRVADWTEDAATAFRARHDIGTAQQVLALLPGSRGGEVTRLLPLFGQVQAQLQARYPDLITAIPVVEGVADLVAAQTADWQTPPRLYHDKQDKDGLFAAANAALVTSGTASLELTAARVPMAVAYKASPLTAFILRRMVKVTYGSLTNIMLDRMAIPEFLQADATVDALMGALTPLLDPDSPQRQAQLADLDKAIDLLGLYGPSPAQNAARVLLSLDGEAEQP